MNKVVSSLLHAGGNAILHTKVRLALLDALGSDALRMEIDVDDGNVTLAGRVRARASGERAGDVARAVGGVKNVRTNIHIVTETPAGTGPLDAVSKEVADRMLEAKVRLRLLEEIGSPALNVRIEATDGTVAILGDADERDLLARAERAAKSIGGVNLVVHEAGAQVR